MKKLYLISVSLIVCGVFTPGTCKAQETSLGISAGLNNTFFHQGKSDYNKGFFRPLMDQGFNMAVPLCVDLVPHWSLRSGIGYALKQFSFVQDSFAQAGISGMISQRLRTHALEIPLILGFKRLLSEKKYLFEYQLGLVATFNMSSPGSLSYSWDDKGSDSLIAVSGHLSDNRSGPIVGTDLYAAISLIRFSAGARRHQFSLSYQYGFLPVLDREFVNSVRVPSGTYMYTARLRPQTSYLALCYTFFPAWFQWGRGDEAAK